MPPKKSTPSPAAAPASAMKPTHTISTASSQPTKPQNKPPTTTTTTTTTPRNASEIAQGIWNQYVTKTPQRVKLLDAFMGFLMVVGALQFVYCVVAGNYPFNAFLSGFSATVGQFVLTASLRIQTNPENEKDFQRISHERAFADFVFGSMILHFFCVNFIN
ncbi:defender against death DAD protein [Teratosphaeria destructans]|uniref:Dolichyl-diphosphooligosaccharide--protein glycosyltransferase subunit OST2 n=1 Tax=Teratosphaeria destructans TaxID=418781 RepID=A0A9W7W5M8_9PEZI|nr:defender against death DAD protein [Teratosphaeria destructans]